MPNDNPTQEPSTSPVEDTGAVHQMDQIDLERKAEADLLAFAASQIGETPQNEEIEQQVAQVSEDASADEEELVEDDADVESPDEAEDTDSNDESDQDDELELVSYDDLKGYALEIGGETYTPAQLKSMLGRMKAAGNEAREADQLRKDYEMKSQELELREAEIDRRFHNAGELDQLAQYHVENDHLEKAIHQARQNGDAQNLVFLKDRQSQLHHAYNQAKSRIDETKSEMQRERIDKSHEALRDRGYGYLIDNDASMNALNDFAETMLSAEEMNLVANYPGIIAMAELARKYSTSSNKKAKKQLKTSGKTLRPGQNPTKTVNKKQELSPEDYFSALAKDVFGS